MTRDNVVCAFGSGANSARWTDRTTSFQNLCNALAHLSDTAHGAPIVRLVEEKWTSAKYYKDYKDMVPAHEWAWRKQVDGRYKFGRHKSYKYLTDPSGVVWQRDEQVRHCCALVLQRWCESCSE